MSEPSTETDALRLAAVEQFISFTGVSDEQAQTTLEACDWNVEYAVNMHFTGVDSNDVQREPLRESNELPTVPIVSNANPSDGEEVRPPIPPKRQVLVDDDSYINVPIARTRPQSVFDGFRNFQDEARWQQEGSDGAGTSNGNKRRTLEDLFRPPLDLLYRGSMNAAREAACQSNKWLLVNVQNVREFACQVLNRDVWSNTAVKEIISEHFIFWQVYHDSNDGSRYMQFYGIKEFPYVAILDPRTGEKMSSLSQGIDAITFCDFITAFLAEHPSPNGTVTTVATTSTTASATVTNPSQVTSTASCTSQWYKSNVDDSEAEQLKAAIEASLKDMATPKNHCDKIESDDDCDDDMLETFDSDDSNLPSKSDEKSSKSANEQPTAVNLPEEQWENYLGPDDGRYSELVIRLPDGQRQMKSFPAESQLKIILLYIASLGYNLQNYDVVTNHPRKSLKDMEPSLTLSSVGLFPRQAIFVHQIS